MSQSNSGLDILIVGAGPTGLALATQLQSFAVRFRIIDRLRDRTRESRAFAVQARTLELLQMLDLGEQLVARGNASTRVKLHVEGRAVAEITLGDFAAVDTRFPFILFVSQVETEEVLHEYLRGRGVVVERGTELVAFEPDADGVDCVLHGEDGRRERVRARFLIGCDGAHSIVRKASGIEFGGGTYPQEFALGDVEADGPLDSEAINAFAGGGGVALFFPIGRPATWRVVAVAADPQTEPGQGRTSSSGVETRLQLSDLQQLVGPPTAEAIRLRDAAWLTRFHLHHRQVARYRIGNVFLAGDAAHIHSPVGGQGMNTGIQDAWNLGWKLGLVVRGLAHDRLLETYHDERWPVGHFLLRYTDRLFGAFMRVTSARPLATWARRVVAPHVVPHVLESRRLRQTAFGFVSELGIRYRKSPAVAEGEAALPKGPRAGDRLPDAEVLANGRATSLQQALAGPRLALLLCGDSKQWDLFALGRLQERYGVLATHFLSATESDGALVDATGAAFARLGVQQTAQYLVRPDGYIAFRSAARTFEQLDRYLADWYVMSG